MYFNLCWIYILFGLCFLDQLPFTNQTNDELRGLGWNVHCKLQPNSYDCSRNETSEGRFYYDIVMQACKTFYYAECDLSFNTFNKLTDCMNRCGVAGAKAISEHLSNEVNCRLQPDFGGCNDYFPMWYYDVSERRCKGFSYSGCGGNGNRFSTAAACADVCSTAVGRHKRVQTPRV